jgi:hypothetical protein
MHILDDFHFQGCLANLKQKSWWAANAPDTKYKNDWIPALLAHCISWSMMIMAPCVIFMDVPVWLVVIMLVFNVAIHFIVDNAKCNRFLIGLVEDQMFHLAQIIFTFLVFSMIPEMIL